MNPNSSFLCNTMLKSKHNRDEQDKLSGNVIIRGVRDDEGAGTALKKIAELSACSLQPDDVKSVKQQQYHNKGSVITAQFKNRETKKQFIKAAKQRKISTQMYGYDGEPQPIFVDPQITRKSFFLSQPRS